MTDKFTDKTLMPFGQHKGLRLEDVPADYFIWWADNAESTSLERYHALSAYIDEVREILEEEVADGAL